MTPATLEPGANEEESGDLLALIFRHAMERPTALALLDDNVSLSYSELLDASGRVAAGLSGIGISAGDRVALHLGNSAMFVTVALGCLWLGASFVPISPEDPATRVSRILEDCEPLAVVVRDGAVPPLGMGPNCGAVRAASLITTAGAPPARASDHARDAYLVYTSGTTGAPKGVCVQEHALTWSVSSAVQYLGYGQMTRSLAASAFHFDGSFSTLFGTLVGGGTLVVPPREELLFIRPFFRNVLEHNINATSFSPSYLRMLVSSRDLKQLAGSDLSTVAIGGEECVASDVARLWEVLPQARIFNRYGPTESTIAVTSYQILAEDVAAGVIPLGEPHAGVSFYLLSPNGLVDQPGELGALYIGGKQLMRGYWGDRQLSEQVLRADLVPGHVVYETGDLAYRDDMGRYIWAGRVDDVVKRRGVRIGLSEVARVFAAVEGVRAAICLAVENAGRLEIVAYVEADTDVTQAELVAAGGAQLPAAMLPDDVVVVGSLPVNSVGKVDRGRLLAASGRVAWRNR